MVNSSTFHATFVSLFFGLWFLGGPLEFLIPAYLPTRFGTPGPSWFSLRCVISGRAATEMREMEAEAGPGCETGRTGSNKRMGRNCI